MSKSLPLSCKEYYSQRNYTVYQQAVFLAILNQHYELVLKQSSKRSVVTSQLVRVIKIGNINDTIKFGVTFESVYSSGKNNSNRMETIYSIYTKKGLFMNKKKIEEVGRVISNYFEETVHDTQSSVIPINDQTLQSFL
ncbi:TATA-binding protein-associated phosphoprotein [Entamoeba marina]